MLQSIARWFLAEELKTLRKTVSSLTIQVRDLDVRRITSDGEILRLQAMVPQTQRPYAVIYDVLHDDGELVTEEYYGFFGSQEEAVKLFNGAFPPGDPRPNVGSARLVQIVKDLRDEKGTVIP